MGFWDHDAVSVVSRKSHSGKTKYTVERRGRDKSRDRSRSRSSSRSRHSKKKKHKSSLSAIFGGGHHSRHSSSRASFFSLPGGSRSSFFGLGPSRSSYYKRSPRKNFLQRAYKKLKELLRDLLKHAKRHPWKVAALVLVPLMGALTALLARFGLRLPPGAERLIGMAGKAAGVAGGGQMGLVGEAVKMAGNFAGGSGGGDKRRGPDSGLGFGSLGGLGGLAGSGGRKGDGWGDGISSAMKMFK